MGVFIFNNGRKYDGQWVNSRAEGRGVCIYEDGSKYDGLCRNGNWNGSGRLELANGHIFETTWQDGKDPNFDSPPSLVEILSLCCILL
jgi:hypothetical protein